MPARKSTTTTAATAAPTTSTTASASSASTPAAEKPKRTRKPKVPETVPEVSSTVEETSPTSDAGKSRVVPTRESVDTEVDSIVTAIDEEIARMTASKNKGTKFLRSVNKRLKTLRSHISRISRRKTGTRRNNENSGFRKPAQISADLAKFTGWSQKEPRCRVDVTKFICDYIREHKLQNPEDRRIILADSKLRSLLKLESDSVLKYPTLQKYLKNHFTKVAEPATVAATPAPAVAATPSKKSSR